MCLNFEPVSPQKKPKSLNQYLYLVMKSLQQRIKEQFIGVTPGMNPNAVMSIYVAYLVMVRSRSATQTDYQ